MVLFVVVAVLLHLPTLLNPGYMSHDELQWAARADVPSFFSLPWVDWTDWRAFQYRPLTFDLWLRLSYLLFNTPMAFHAAWVAMGIGNGLMLMRLLQRLQVGTVATLLFCLGFVLGPFAAFTHGWVATLADLMWVGLGLIVAQVIFWAQDKPSRHGLACALVLVLTSLALLFKEAAIVLPALIGLAWLLGGRTRLLRDAMIFALVPVLVYLAVRANVILFTPRAPGVYQWSLLSIPKQWLMYQMYPLAPGVTEIHTLTMSTKHAVIAGLVWLAMTFFVFRAGLRAGLVFLLGGAMALGPVLILEFPSGQYGYGFAAVTMAGLALAWQRMPTAGRSLAVLFVAIGVWHGFNVQRMLRHEGDLQARYSPAMAEAVRTSNTTPVRLKLPADEGWLFQRVSHEIPSYAGVPIGERVLLVSDGPAEYVIEADGSLTRAVPK